MRFYAWTGYNVTSGTGQQNISRKQKPLVLFKPAERAESKQKAIWKPAERAESKQKAIWKPAERAEQDPAAWA